MIFFNPGHPGFTRYADETWKDVLRLKRAASLTSKSLYDVRRASTCTQVRIPGPRSKGKRLTKNDEFVMELIYPYFPESNFHRKHAIEYQTTIDIDINNRERITI